MFNLGAQATCLLPDAGGTPAPPGEHITATHVAVIVYAKLTAIRHCHALVQSHYIRCLALRPKRGAALARRAGLGGDKACPKKR
jgi:hypothetical protein